MAQVAFEGVVFEGDFASARTPGGETVRFTRQERTVLNHLVNRPGRLLTRGELHAAMGSRGSDRNVDFVINRLRSKLGDLGAERRFIFTQYGEGYIWLAQASAPPDHSGLLVIGPVRGGDEDLVTATLGPLHTALGQRLGARTVQLKAETAPAEASDVRFSLEVSFHRTAIRTHAAFVLRAGPGRAIAHLADALADAIWRHLSLGPPGGIAPSDPPLHLRLVEASALLDPPGATWIRSGEQLARLRANAPDDPTVAIMSAMHLLAESIMVMTPEGLTRAAIRAVEDKVEALTLTSVPAVRDDPVLAQAAAILLLLINRGHADLAEELVDYAFASGAGFAAGLLMMGRIRAYRGDLDEADRLYDEGLSFCEPGSKLEIYALTIKAIARVAAEDYPAAAAIYRRLSQLQPPSWHLFKITFLPPGDEGLGRELGALADRATLEYARRLVAYLWFRVADLFCTRAHAAAVMRGPLTHLVRRLGPTVASDEIWAEMPDELQYLRAARP
jgi:tetratricopeptide (TPR) repeat protein